MARAQAKERTRDALLDAAAEEFFSGGTLGTLEGLASKVKVTKQTLLRHFGSKEGLFQQALARSASEVLDQRWSAPVGDVEGAVENLLEHYEEWGERGMRLEAWQISPTPFARLARMGRRIHAEWIEYAFAPWLDARDEQARTRLRAQLIAICDVQVWWVLTHYLKLERDEVKAALVDMIEKLVGPEPARSDARRAPTKRASSTKPKAKARADRGSPPHADGGSSAPRRRTDQPPGSRAR